MWGTYRPYYEKEIVSMDLLYQQALEKLIYLKTIFPKFYLELQYHGLEQERIVMPLIVKMAKETNTPLIAANDAHITYGTDECIKARQIVRYPVRRTPSSFSVSRAGSTNFVPLIRTLRPPFSPIKLLWLISRPPPGNSVVMGVLLS